MRARTVLPATVAVAAMLLVGCTGPTDDSPGPTTFPANTPSPSPTPEPSPTPTDGIQVHSDPTVGIVFENVPTLSGDEAEVYNWVAIHQNAFWETIRTNQVSSTFATTTSSEMQALMQGVAADNAAQGLRIAGEFHTWISDIVVSEDAATATKCDDFRQATFTTDAGEFTAEDVKQDIPKRSKVELVRLDGGKWYITKVVGDGTC